MALSDRRIFFLLSLALPLQIFLGQQVDHFFCQIDLFALFWLIQAHRLESPSKRLLKQMLVWGFCLDLLSPYHRLGLYTTSLFIARWALRPIQGWCFLGMRSAPWLTLLFCAVERLALTMMLWLTGEPINSTFFSVVSRALIGAWWSGLAVSLLWVIISFIERAYPSAPRVSHVRSSRRHRSFAHV